MGTVITASFRSDEGNLPPELTSFVDREDQVAEAKAQLSTSRLVTLVGMGVVGKTRLALRVAEAVQAQFDDGVWLVQLDQLQDPALLADSVAATLGLQQQAAGPPLDILVEYLSERRLLLLLDNCEQLLDACVELALRVLQSCPDVRILATSREPLGIRGEATLPVPPLALPDGGTRHSLEEVSGYDAVTLFTERATAADPKFTLDEDNQAAVAEICKGLEGLPLAIELAAARVRMLPVDEISRRLSDLYGLLTTRLRAVPARHRTLWACLEWSYDLCSREKRLVWSRLSVFTGGFELDAAETVCAGDGLAAGTILDLLAALVDKSIVVREPAGNLARYRLLEMIRDFGGTKLGEAGEDAILRRRHCDWYIQFVSEADADWIGPRQVDWLQRMDREVAILRAALEFCLTDPGEAEVGLQMTAALTQCYWVVRGRLSEARHWLHQALARGAGRNRYRLRALYALSGIVLMQGDVAGASGLVEQERELADELGDPSARAQAAYGSGLFALLTGDQRSATVYFQECLDRFREEGNLRSQLETLGGLGVSVAVEDERRAIAYVEESLEISEFHGEIYQRIHARWVLSIASWREGDHERATALVTQALEMSTRTENDITAGWCFEVLAWIAASIHDQSRAASLLGVAHAIADAMGVATAIPPYLVGYHQECERQTRGALGEEAFESAFERGLSLSPADAVAYATQPTLENEPPRLAQVDPPPTRPEQPAAEEAAGEQQRPTLRVLVVDRHRVEADGIQMVLERHPDLEVAGTATHCGGAVALAAATHPDVILADYQLPDSTGAELAARLRRDEPASRVLLLSSVTSDPLLQEAVKAGARGFLLKTQPAEELVEAVRRAGAGEMLIPGVRLAALLADSDTDARLFDPLTGREHEVLRLLAAGLENKVIAARMGVGYVTVRSHMRNLSSKLDARSRLEVVAKASELGLIGR